MHNTKPSDMQKLIKNEVSTNLQALPVRLCQQHAGTAQNHTKTTIG